MPIEHTQEELDQLIAAQQELNARAEQRIGENDRLAHELQRRESELAANQSVLEERAVNVQSREQAAESREADILAREESLKTKRDEHDGEVSLFTDHVASEETRLSALADDIKSATAKAEREATERSQGLESREDALAERETTLADREASVASREMAADKLAADLEEKEQTMKARVEDQLRKALRVS